jgi:hypothetical protein
MRRLDEEIDLVKTFIPFKNLLPETKDLSDKVFKYFANQIENFDGFYKMDQTYSEYNLTDVQKHFLISLFVCVIPWRQSPEQNEKLQEAVDKIYEQLGYKKFNIVDKEFNRKVYQYIMFNEKVI